MTSEEIAVETHWRGWWSLPPETRQKIEDYEESIGSELSWNQRYLLFRGNPSN